MRGLVRIEVIKRLKGRNERSRQEGHNMISNGGLTCVMHEAMSRLIGASSYTGGTKRTRHSFSSMGTAYNSGGYSSDKLIYHGSRQDRSPCCALLGLNDSVYTSLDSRKGFLPLLSSSGSVDTNAVRALASLAPSAGSAVGVSEKINAASIADISRIGRKYDFPEGTGTGNISGVAIIPGSFVPGSVPCGGAISFTRMDDFNIFTDQIAGCQDVIPPGVDGLGLAVRMKYTTADSVTIHTRNLVTGELTDGAGTEFMPQSSGERVIFDDGTYIYTVYYSSIYKYAKNNNYTRTAVTYGASVQNAGAFAGGFVYNGTTYIVRLGDLKQSRYEYFCEIINASAGTYQQFDSKSSLATYLSTTFGITIPADWITDSKIRCYGPVTLGNNVGLCCMFETATFSGYGFLMDVYVTSDPSSPITNLVDVIPQVDMSAVLWNYGTACGVLEIGCGTDALYSMTSDTSMSSTQILQGAYKSSATRKSYGGDSNLTEIITNSSGYEYVVGVASGVWISMRGMWSTWLSVKQLEEDVDKSETTDVKVEYDYAFEGTGTTPVSSPT